MTQTVDTFKAGNPDTPVTGIAVTMMATLDVLQRAAANHQNFIITHEPTFFSHQDQPEGMDESDPVWTQKRAFIEQNHLVVWRFHDHWHRRNPDGILAGSASKILQLAALIALNHHERWDGTGYPNKLKGTDIPLAARICAVGDVFDALISKRPYKEPWTPAAAFKAIEKTTGSHFDPMVVEALFCCKAEIESILHRFADMSQSSQTAQFRTSPSTFRCFRVKLSSFSSLICRAMAISCSMRATAPLPR